MSLAIVVLISGNGSNLQAIIDAIGKGLDVKIRAVISNRPEAFGLQRAAQAGIPTYVIDYTHYNRRDFEAALREKINVHTPDLIILAGFMRKLTADFVHLYSGRLINIHPSLLPKYPGLNTHHRVLSAGETRHGVTIHYVTAEVDAGPLICQAALNVEPGETEKNLEQRIHALEHRLYPQVLSWFAEGIIAPLEKPPS